MKMDQCSNEHMDFLWNLKHDKYSSAERNYVSKINAHEMYCDKNKMFSI
jgi:hypothetical protein